MSPHAMLFTAVLAAAVAVPPAPGHPGTPAPEPLEPPDIRLSRVRLSTGVELEVAESGARQGEPVLFLHGYTDSWFSYSPVLQQLPASIRSIVPTQRGHGDSERPMCCYRVEDFAADAVALLDALGLERVTVVGHSMGSFVAQRIAIDHPERVSRLVLIGSGTIARIPALVELAGLLQTLTDPIADEFIREFQESTAFNPLPSAFLQGLVAESGKLPARVWRDALTELLTLDAPAELQRVQVPTLIVWGEQDELWMRPEQDALVDGISGAVLVTYPQTGHAPHWEHPRRFAQDLQAFLHAPTAGL